MDPNPFVSRSIPGASRGMTVAQMRNYLSDMPDQAVIVVEGGRLIDPHLIVDVLAPEEQLAVGTVLLSVGPEYKEPSDI